MSRQRILVFRIGNVGDSLIALPALWFIREHYEHAHLTLLCNQSTNPRELAASDIFRDTSLFDEVLHYRGTLSTLPLCGPALDYSRLLAAIRWRRFDRLIYLPPSRRTTAEVARDAKFFRLAGIRDMVGFNGMEPFPLASQGVKPLARQPQEAQLLLDRLRASGLPVPPLAECRLDVGVTRDVRKSFQQWLAGQVSDGERPWVALGIGTKMPAKQWPVDRFQSVVSKLIQEFDVWPVIFGGTEDRGLAESLLTAWGRGYSAAGELTLCESIAGIERCDLYLGNDTGTMHMAASAGVRCVAIFSARDWPGKWYPIGTDHVVLRKSVDCEGCLLMECRDRANDCLTRISTDEVFRACRQILQGHSLQRHDNADSLANTFDGHAPAASFQGWND